MTQNHEAAPTITLVHAVLPALAPMQTALEAEIPGITVRHLLDEGLSTEAVRQGGLTRVLVERMLTLLTLAAAAPTDAILLTCTAYSTMVPEAQKRFPDLPIFAVDSMMVETAVKTANRIGVLATFPAGLEQQREMLTAQALLQGKSIEILSSLHPEAMIALRAGDAATHDRIVLDALPALAERCDLLLLAQVSMARVLPGVPEAYRARVLSSPRLAAQALQSALARPFAAHNRSA
ncbi:MAG: aspartate/glutamate racemase family protein [Candidatus Velthaea sp.]